MNVNLTPQLEEMIKKKVASGLYNSASEVVREALRLMEEQDRVRSVKLEQLRQDIRDGLNSGEPTPWDAEEIKREGRKRRASRTNPSHDEQKISQNLQAVENAIAQQRLEGLEVPPDVAEEMKLAAKGEIGIEEGIRNTVLKFTHDKI